MPTIVKFEPAYLYKAKVLEIHDGDTFTCDIDCGFNVIIRQRQIRMWGINAPELKLPDRKTKTKQGAAATEHLKKLIADKEVIIATFKDKTEKYGRLLGVVFLKDENKQIINVNEEMVKSGHAIEYMTK